MYNLYNLKEQSFIDVLFIYWSDKEWLILDMNSVT